MESREFLLIYQHSSRVDLQTTKYSCVLQGSQAYAKALARAGVLTAEEAAQIVEGLGQVLLNSVKARQHSVTTAATSLSDPLTLLYIASCTR